jgi:PAS domain S-box-containing protein
LGQTHLVEGQYSFLAGGGETARIIESFDWSGTRLGSLDQWPDHLRNTVALILRSPVPIVTLWGEDGIMIYNDAYSQFAGGRHPALFGSKVREGWPEVADFNDNVMRAGLAGRTLSYRDQQLTLSRNGKPEQVWLNLDYSPLVDQSGKPVGVIAIVIETTAKIRAMAEEKRAASALLESDTRFRLVAESAPVMLWMGDRTGKCIYLNAALREFWGVAEESVSTFDWGQTIHPEDQDILSQPFSAAMEAHTPFAVEARFKRADGMYRILQAEAQPRFDQDGTFVGMIGVNVDVTDTRKAEESGMRLAAIVESSTDAVVSKNLGGIIQSWNKGAERLFGYTAEEAIGQPVLMLIPPDYQNEEPAIIERIRRGEHVAPYDTIRRRKDGQLIPVSLTVSPVRDGTGKIVGASKIARDITSRKESEQAIRLLMREVNHRVKNQYSVILSMIRETRERARNPEDFERGVRERIMALSRSHDLLVSADWKGAPLRELLLSQLQPFGNEDRIHLSGPPIMLKPNAVQYLGIAFHELATNSVKYGVLNGSEGSLEVTWSIRADERGDKRFSLNWCETGGSAISPPAGKGFGTVVIERVAPQAVDGTSEVAFGPTGVNWVLEAPMASIESTWDSI